MQATAAIVSWAHVSQIRYHRPSGVIAPNSVMLIIKYNVYSICHYHIFGCQHLIATARSLHVFEERPTGYDNITECTTIIMLARV